MIHTPELWKICKSFGGYILNDSNGIYIDMDDYDNLARAASCVNALAGMNPDAVVDVIEACKIGLGCAEWMASATDADEEDAENVRIIRAALRKLRAQEMTK